MLDCPGMKKPHPVDRDRLARRMTWVEYARFVGVSRQTLHKLRMGGRCSDLVKAKVQAVAR